MSEHKKYTADDIDLSDKRISAFGIALSMSILVRPERVADTTLDTRNYLASALTWFDAMGLDVVLREEDK